MLSTTLSILVYTDVPKPGVMVCHCSLSCLTPWLCLQPGTSPGAHDHGLLTSLVSGRSLFALVQMQRACGGGRLVPQNAGNLIFEDLILKISQGGC